MQKIRMKLQYEWKNIYRSLSSTDSSDVGMVTKKQFDDILQNYGVFISNEELKMLLERFNCGNGS
jgi:hypothetical protein